jgi:hypothetical protein
MCHPLVRLKVWRLLGKRATRVLSSTVSDSSGGLLTGGAGATPSSDLDITYATPISFILERMQDDGLRRPNVNPVLTDTFTRLTLNETQQFIPETLATQ